MSRCHAEPRTARAAEHCRAACRDGSMSMMAASLRSRAATVWKRHAMLLGSGVTGVKTCVADLLVQTQYEQREEIDWSRTFVVCTRHQTLMAPDHCPDVPPLTSCLPVSSPHSAYSTWVPSNTCSTQCGFHGFSRELASLSSRNELPLTRSSIRGAGTIRCSMWCSRASCMPASTCRRRRRASSGAR